MIVEPKIARENGIEIDIGLIRQRLLRGGGWFWPSWLIKLINLHRAPRCRCTPLYTAAWRVSAWSRGMGLGFSYVDQFDGIPASGFISRYISTSREDGLTDTICCCLQKVKASNVSWLRLLNADLHVLPERWSEILPTENSLTNLYTKMIKDTLYCFIH